MKILVTGGAGFIGSAVIRHIISNTADSVINVDKLTYAGNFASLAEASQNHISTDEVYGDLDGPEDLFTETTPYQPSSPYSASKASSDHLFSAWSRTYGLPSLITNCSNNYGPCHFPEKLIPLIIFTALEGKPLPVYGKGNQVRDWLYVEDLAPALYKVVTEGAIGETSNIGGHNEKQNIEVVHTLCALLDELHPGSVHRPHASLLTYVQDRPGHDQRYAIDASKIQRELGWVPEETFETGTRKTVERYLNNTDWVERVKNGSYQQWIDQSYAGRSSTV